MNHRSATATDAPAILVVDDDVLTRRIVARTLGALGADIDDVASGEEAVAATLARGYAVVLLDVQMPGIDGFETARRLRERGGHSGAIVFLTAVEKRLEQITRAYQLGAVDYLFKPVEPIVLRTRVRLLLDLWEREQALREQAAHLARSNADLELYGHAIAHDLRGPLAAAHGLLQLVLRKEDLTDKARDLLGQALRCTSRMDALIASLREIGRIDAEPVAPAWVDAGEALDAALEHLEPEVEATGAVLQRSDMPVLAANPQQLIWLFQNLVGNALKFRGDAPPVVRIEATPSTEADGLWVIAVHDNGIGIASEDAERIFGVFERLHPQDAFPGTGVGLAIARRIVQRHGGRIWLEPTTEAGATFCFSLPGRR